MTTLRTYGNLAEAGFAKSLLESAGIRAELADEHSYGLGYGVVVCELRLQVEEADLERARKVLEEGPDVPVSPAMESAGVDQGPGLARKGARFPAGIFVASGAADAWIEFQNGDPIIGKVDMDFNGVPDEIYEYKDGLPIRSQIKPNDSSKPTRTRMYTHRMLAEELVDSDQDGKPDYRIKYDAFSNPSEHLPIEAGK
jgi:Putative prokaryotic signal transducing protein